MRDMFRSRNFWFAAIALGGFWPVASLLPRYYLFDIVNALTVAACVGVVVAFAPSVWRLVLRNDLDGAHYFVMGVCGSMIGNSARHLWNWVWRWLDKPPYMQDHIFVAFLIWIIFIAACLHLMARDVVEGYIPRENWRWLGIVMGVGLGIGLLAVTFLDPHGPLFVGFIE